MFLFGGSLEQKKVTLNVKGKHFHPLSVPTDTAQIGSPKLLKH